MGRSGTRSRGCRGLVYPRVVAGRWFFDDEPAHAPASLEAETGLRPDVPLEAETTVNAGLSARVEETKPIRTDGPATAAVGGAADGQQDVLLDLVTSESRLVTARLVEEVAGLQRELDEQQRRIRKLSEALAEAQAVLDVNEARRATAAGASAAPGGCAG